MKIIFIIEGLNSGGAARAISNIVNRLAENTNYQLSLINLNDKKSLYSFPSHCFIHSTNPRRFIHLQHTLFIRKKLKELNPDIVISFIHQTNIKTIIANSFLKFPILISERSNPRFQQLSAPWEILRRITYPFCKKLIVQSTRIAAYFKFIPTDQISIIGNILSKELLANLQLPKVQKKENIIINTSRFHAIKNYELLIRSFATAMKELNFPNWTLQLIGAGHQKEKMVQLVDDLKASTYIRFSEPTTNIFEQVKKAKLFVLTSDSEGFPNSLLEARLLGLDCMSTDVSGVDEIKKMITSPARWEIINKDNLKDKLKIYMSDKTTPHHGNITINHDPFEDWEALFKEFEKSKN